MHPASLASWGLYRCRQPGCVGQRTNQTWLPLAPREAKPRAEHPRRETPGAYASLPSWGRHGPLPMSLFGREAGDIRLGCVHIEK
jgi:hypothetical protein